MTQEEAKDILAAYRADLPEEEAPGVSEALVLLREDRELNDWFEEEQRFDEAFSLALAGIDVPTDLYETVLSGAPSAEETGSDESTASKDKVIAFPRRNLFLAVAAAVVLSAAGLIKYFMFPPPVTFPGSTFATVEEFSDGMAHYANSRFVLSKLTPDFNEAREWLRAKESPVYDEAPANIVEFEGMGCQSFAWGPHRVSLVCFKDATDEIVHLFVVSKDAFEELAPEDQLRAVQVRHELETGGWMGGDNLYLLVGSEPDVSIGDLLASSETF